VIQLAGVVKAFESRAVLKGVHLEVGAGEFLTLVGPNGAGKTTLINLIATLSRPTGGRLRVAGYDPAQDPVAVRRRIGLVSHRTLLYDDLSGEENLRFYARMYDVPHARARIEAMLQRVGLWGRQHDPVRTYSRGMQQRLAIARALLHEPPVLLLDEPDTGLDRHSSAALSDLLRQPEGARRTVLMTTHNLERAAAWGDRVAILAGGRIVFQSARADLDAAALRTHYDRYVNATSP
jgi:heme exporter protein A